MHSKLRTYGRIFLDTFSGWLALVGFVFSIFAVFSVLVSLFDVGLSAVFRSFLDFYAGFRNNIFWPVSKLFSLELPDLAKDIIVFWAITGAISIHVLLWFTDRIQAQAEAAYNKATDPVLKQAYIERHGQAKYDDELAFAKSQMDRGRRPDSTIALGVVTTIAAMAVGFAGFLFVAIVNPNHETVPVSGRGLLLIHVVVVLVVLLAFFVLNFLLPPVLHTPQ